MSTEAQLYMCTAVLMHSSEPRVGMDVWPLYTVTEWCNKWRPAVSTYRAYLIFSVSTNPVCEHPCLSVAALIQHYRPTRTEMTFVKWSRVNQKWREREGCSLWFVLLYPLLLTSKLQVDPYEPSVIDATPHTSQSGPWRSMAYATAALDDTGERWPGISLSSADWDRVMGSTHQD